MHTLNKTTTTTTTTTTTNTTKEENEEIPTGPYKNSYNWPKHMFH